ncbi:glutathionylspermidine synthase family protein [bacterium]|nr:MAG: glutathionylspermidine synthase family protein [bacterium]
MDQNLLPRLGIPAAFRELVTASWFDRHPTLYGRMDFAFDGVGAPKLLEYNADTPTGLLEAAVVQWDWLQDTRPGADQFNSLHEKLIARFGSIMPPGALVHVASASHESSPEDYGTARYLGDVALQAGAGELVLIGMEDIGAPGREPYFIDRTPRKIENLFKLYPWEWLFAEEFAFEIAPRPETGWLEPPWKAMLSNKGLLALMWERFPRHPNLLATFETAAEFGSKPYVVKPVHSREGANIEIRNLAEAIATPGPYTGPVVYQEYAPLYTADGVHAVIGSWVVGNQPAGLGIREDAGVVTTNASRFVPHFFTPA